MSSTCRIICVSHDLALVLHEKEWNDSSQAVDAVINGIRDHPACRLLILRRFWNSMK